MKKILLAGIVSMIFLAGCTQTNQGKNLDDFAKCLTQKGMTMYGSKTCPHCLAQKEMFGDSFTYVNYVECTEEFERCANLKGVPTREISSGNYLEGEQELSSLAKVSGCTLP